MKTVLRLQCAARSEDVPPRHERPLLGVRHRGPLREPKNTTAIVGLDRVAVRSSKTPAAVCHCCHMPAPPLRPSAEMGLLADQATARPIGHPLNRDPPRSPGRVRVCRSPLCGHGRLRSMLGCASPVVAARAQPPEAIPRHTGTNDSPEQRTAPPKKSVSTKVSQCVYEIAALSTGINPPQESTACQRSARAYSGRHSPALPGAIRGWSGPGADGGRRRVIRERRPVILASYHSAHPRTRASSSTKGTAARTDEAVPSANHFDFRRPARREDDLDCSRGPFPGRVTNSCTMYRPDAMWPAVHHDSGDIIRAGGPIRSPTSQTSVRKCTSTSRSSRKNKKKINLRRMRRPSVQMPTMAYAEHRDSHRATARHVRQLATCELRRTRTLPRRTA